MILSLYVSEETRRFVASFGQHLDAVERSSENHQTFLDHMAYCNREIGKKTTRNMLCGCGPWLQVSEETSQSKRFISNFKKHLDPIERMSKSHQSYSEYEAYCTREIEKARTRHMLCGRGTRKFAFDPHHQIEPPYLFDEVDLVVLTGTKAGGHLFNTILSNTIGKLVDYSEVVQSVIRALPDGILGIETFPGSGKTTVAAAIDACLCPGSESRRRHHNSPGPFQMASSASKLPRS